MDASRTTPVDASPERLWQVVTDVAAWPGWTASMTAVTLLDGGPLAAGSRVRIRQPGLRPAVWTVTQLDPGRSFTWESAAPGVRTVAGHHVTTAAGGTELTLTLAQTGPFAGLIGLLYGRKVEHFIGLELAGLRAAAEGGQGSTRAT